MQRLLLTLLLAVLLGCNSQSQPTPTPAPAGSSVSIIGISPTTDQPLRVGQRVRLEVRVAYTLAVDSGTLALIVQEPSNSVQVSSRTNIQKGSGNEEFAAEFTVPNTDKILVFVPLAASGQESTTTVATRDFKVVRQ